MSSSHLAIFCIILISFFALHECGNVKERNLDARSMDDFSPCFRRRCYSSLLLVCHCCRGAHHYCSHSLKRCEAACLKLNPPPSSFSLKT
ncbi:hypothetical protein CARUB_v10028239mg [Capsella rubella]|uniref:Embryo surrounding factor 1 brassicaceae domain-containing protein n=2 Tax=Capsella rubella TaxID=81985 RepID=R0GJF0_9BRAS|nr:hypothetical protein CARUB_v10028239mg [Capsella rubella]